MAKSDVKSERHTRGLPDLYMFKEECDTVIAESKDDAAKVWALHTGCTEFPDGRNDVPTAECWAQIPDDQQVTLSFPEDEAATMTAAEWCAKDGRGFWGSTEY